MIGMGDAIATDGLVSDLRTIFGARLRAVVVYGENDGASAPGSEHDRLTHTFAAVDSLTYDDLRRCAAAADRWAIRGFAAPLLLAGDEFARSLDAFPIEYGAIIADHRVVFGRDPFDGLAVRNDDLRRACEIQAKSHLLHLREAYMECGGRDTEVARLIVASAASFRVLLNHVARLHGENPHEVDAPLRFAEAIRLSPDVVRVVLALRSAADLGPADAERLFPAYLETADRLARFVDTWTAS
jgi:hypothetical protein